MDVPIVVTPLPNNKYDLATQREWHEAFESCKKLETANSWDLLADHQQRFSKDLMFQTSCAVAARTLGYALIYSLHDKGRDFVAHEVNSCNNEPELLAALAHLFIFGLIRVFKNPKGPTPVASTDVSPRSSYESTVQNQQEISESSGATPGWLKQKVLVRDDYACVFTGRMDAYSVLRNIVPKKPGVPAGPLRVAHIISQSLTLDIGGLSERAKRKFNWASTPAAVLSRFSGTEIQELLPSMNVHDPLNAFMAQGDVHTYFDELSLWLTPVVVNGVNIADTYHTHAVYPDIREWQRILPEVHFRKEKVDKEDVPPPHPTLIALHAACTQIAHLSGAGEVLDKFYDDEEFEELHGLARNAHDMSFNPVGASALERALHRLQVGAA